MASQFRIEKIVGQEPWESQYGKMIEWRMVVRDLATDRSGPCSVNAKPDNPYSVGETFWAEHNGMRNGVAKLKRVKPPPGAPAAEPRAEGPGLAGGRPHAVPYEKAVEVYKKMAADFDKEHGYEHTYATTMFLAWLGGKIADPEAWQPNEPEGPEPEWGDS